MVYFYYTIYLTKYWVALEIINDLVCKKLIDDYSNFSNAEMIEIQIRKFEAELNKVLNTNTEELIVIHGIGTGILKENIHKILNEYKLRYYLSSDGGSTTIFLYG